MSLTFWKSWNLPNRLTYLVGLGVLLLALGWFCFAWYRGLTNVVAWQVLDELVGLPASLHTVTDGLLTYPIPGQVQAVMCQFMAEPMQVYPLAATGTLIGLGAAFALLLAGVCRLPAWLYRLGMVLFILLLAVSRFDSLNLPGPVGKWAFPVLTLLFGGLSYYFHAFATRISFAQRTWSFAGLIGLTGAGLYSLAGVAYPAQVLVSYALPGLLLLSIGFIILISIEPIMAMVWLTSVSRQDGQSGSKPLGLINFLFISILYLLNLLLIWLKNTRTVDWDILTISPFLIVILSIGLGVWGFRRGVEQQAKFSFPEAGAGIYVGGAILTLLTMAYAFATANDPLVEVFEDAIVYSHFAMGVGVTLYVALNFWPIYQQQLPVYRVVYKARLADLPLFRLAGLVGIVGMVAGGNYFVVRQGQAALESAIGDAYTAEQKPELALTFYQQSLGHEFLQHKANYAVASMARLRNDQTTAAQFLAQSLQKQPSPQAFAALSDTYRQTNLFFEAIKTLQRGIRTFPNSGELRTNLGYLYGKTAIADSAYYYLQSAVGQTVRDDVPQANLLAVYAKNPQILAADSTLASQIEANDSPAFTANSLALQLVTKRNAGADSTAATTDVPTWLAQLPADQGLDAGQFARLYNYALTTPHPDSTLVNELQRAALNPANQNITDELLLATALARYKAAQQPEAFDLLTQLADNDPRRRTAYRTTLGLLEMEQGLSGQAARTFALNATDTLSMLYRAVALTKLDSLPAARPLWTTATRTDPTLRGVAEALYSQKTPATDLEKAMYVAYRPDDANRGRLWETIQNIDLKTVSGSYLISDYLATRQYFYAQMILSQMGAPSRLSAFARSTENLSTIRITAYRNKTAATDSLTKTFFLPIHRGEVAALRGRVFAKANRLTDARAAYETALRLAPANPAIVAEAANFMRTHKQVKEAYNAVLRALSVSENNPDLLKSYVLLCADQSLFNYAEQGLVRLNFATTPADYQAFEAAYQQKLTAVEKQRQQFVN